MGRIKSKVKSILENRFNRRVSIVKITPELLEQEVVYRPMVNVLFIDGCGEVLPHPSRYRVTHQRQQLEMMGITTDQVYVGDLTPDMARNAHVFVFFRCAYNEVIGQFIDNATILGRKLIYDIDDLVIHTRYTDLNPYVAAMPEADKAAYDANVMAMGKLLSMCDAAVTSTEALADELKLYNPAVLINRNTASAQMLRLSEEAYATKCAANDTSSQSETAVQKSVTIGYFSGSITHNDDFELVKNDIIRLMDEDENVNLFIAGILDVPEEFVRFGDRVKTSPFEDYTKLPAMIASVDINIAPLTNNIFNAAKSENKWVESALVRVPTVATGIGAFRHMIEDGVTGFLCAETKWYSTLKKLVEDSELREKVGHAAYEFCVNNCMVTSNPAPLGKLVKSFIRPAAVFVLPSTAMSGGIMVALKHASYFKQAGYDVTLLAHSPESDWMIYENNVFPVLYYLRAEMRVYFDKAVATMWSTADFFERVGTVGEKFYLVQNFEPGFYSPSQDYLAMAERTYHQRGIQYVTISKWIRGWLKDKYGMDARYAPNGLDTVKYAYHKRTMTGKIRVLIEGDSQAPHKRVDESFEIAKRLGQARFEIVYLSYNGEPKEWYLYNEFKHQIPYEQVHEVYESCDILLKSSILESFSYPPLEMMATGGYVVAVINEGNSEYLKDEYNCLAYESGNIEQAVQQIYRIADEVSVRAMLNAGMNDTVPNYDWDEVADRIRAMYSINK